MKTLQLVEPTNMINMKTLQLLQNNMKTLQILQSNNMIDMKTLQLLQQNIMKNMKHLSH